MNFLSSLTNKLLFTLTKSNLKENQFINITEHHLYYSHIQKELIKIKNKSLTQLQILNQLQYFNSISTQHNKYPNTFKQTNKNYQNNYFKQNYYSENTNLLFKQNYHRKNVLLELYQSQIKNIFSLIASFVLQINQESQKLNIPILYSGTEKQILLNKKQIFYILCLMALNLVPIQKYQNKQNNFNKYNNFSYIFSTNPYKTQCVIEYFKKFFFERKDSQFKSNFRIRRQLSNKNCVNFLNQAKHFKLREVSFESHDTSIQDFTGLLKVDFANKYIGGGALGNGCVQEEIMFGNHPELYVLILLCQSMKDNEAIYFQGFKKYFKNKNYGYQTEFNGQVSTQVREKGIQKIIAIDAINFKNNQMDQFNIKLVNRQILKAYIGFNCKQSDKIVTGNWGCGAFKGNISLKFLIQWIACSMAGKNMIYCPYRSNDVVKYKNSIQKMIKIGITVGQLYKFVIAACKKTTHNYQNLFEMIQKLSLTKNLSQSNTFQSKSSSNFNRNQQILMVIFILILIVIILWLILGQHDINWSNLRNFRKEGKKIKKVNIDWQKQIFRMFNL